MAGQGDLADAFARLDGCGADAELIVLAKDCLAPEREHRPRRAGAVVERVTAYLSGVQERLRRAELERVQADARRRGGAEAAQAGGRPGRRGDGADWNRRRRILVDGATAGGAALVASQGINEALFRIGGASIAGRRPARRPRRLGRGWPRSNAPRT